MAERRFDKGGLIGGRTKVLALIGNPVGHSLSPAMHNASFAAEGLDYVYVALNVETGDVPAAVRGAAALGLRGFNVTMPHKRAMVPLMDELDEAARVSGAVNTVAIQDQKLRGYNTDGSGLVEACAEAGIELSGSKVLLLGAGGAAASIAVAFCEAGVGGLHIVNRNADHARDLAAKLREVNEKPEITSDSTDLLEKKVLEAPVIVNATPLGMKDGDPLPLPIEYLHENRTIIDAVYIPGRETALIQASRQRGATTIAGQRMLLYQGVHAQQLWTGRKPNVAAMDRQLV